MDEAFTPELQAHIAHEVAERERLAGQGTIRGLLRVQVQVQRGLTYHATSPAAPGFTLVVDEPTERGGNNQGPPPLMYFLTSVGTCFLMQFIRLAVARKVDVQVESLQVRGEWERAVGGAFRHITQEVHARGPAPPHEAVELLADAEAFCYVHATLRKAVAMTTVLYLNGAEVARRTAGPPPEH